MQEIKYRVVYSSRRTLAISILHDASVIVRVPYRTSDKTITKLINEKAPWILKHTENIRNNSQKSPARKYTDGEIHLFRGNEYVLKIEKAIKPYCKITDRIIELSTAYPDSPDAVRSILYQFYRKAANAVFPEMLNLILHEKASYGFKVSSLRIRTMKSRWGSCTGKGVIAINTELIRLDDKYIRYVMMHELCHLIHHNHGTGFYNLLSQLCPEWKILRKELKGFALR
ncbi:MAG TPA: SprT family zinc-dependent metalloprotease [Bacteroidales bacterium]|nr:SprT family zinc-dependent metalloprotease [Bacteroidales bacterium]